ncbi:hypothetical protein [Streptomyces chartreusis]|uniref:hypothetical protein n=1 Tax=Streptomyces chartreusis TaxID=1969 RepID=UPI0036651E65
MTKSEPEDDSVAPQPDLCDLCGAVTCDGARWSAVVPDSSSITVNPESDGKRLIVGCSRQHLAELAEQYKHRPFIDAELWQGKIARAMRQHPDGVSPETLAEETGLSLQQIEAGVTWRSIDFQHWHQQFGKKDGPDAGD